MLQPKNRLAKIRDFNLLMKHGRFINGSFLSLRVLRLSDAKNYFPLKEDAGEFGKQLKVAFAVGIKISKSAVKRNRFRRQLREAVRLLIKEGKIENGWFLLFVSKNGCLEKTYEEIAAEAWSLLAKANVIR